MAHFTGERWTRAWARDPKTGKWHLSLAAGSNWSLSPCGSGKHSTSSLVEMRENALPVRDDRQCCAGCLNLLVEAA